MRKKYFDNWFDTSAYEHNKGMLAFGYDLYCSRRNGGGAAFYSPNESPIQFPETSRNNIGMSLKA